MLMWSGGLDSTALLAWLCQSSSSAYPVRTIAVNHSMVPCNAQQKKARQTILAELKAKGHHVEHREVDIEANNTGCVTGGICQPLLWLPVGVLALREDEDLYLGYVKGDDIWHYRYALFSAFDSFMAMMQKTGKLQLTYEWTDKVDLVRELRKANLLQHIWYCEQSDNDKPCGKCHSCERHRDVLRRMRAADRAVRSCVNKHTQA